MCYVILANPYPVIYDDAVSSQKLSLYGKANHKHYGCHYVPVVRYGNSMDYRPPKIGENVVICDRCLNRVQVVLIHMMK